MSNFFQKIAQLKSSALQGNVAKNVGLATDVEQLSKAADALDKLKTAQQTAPKTDSNQLNAFDQVLKDLQAANPAGQFQSSAASIGSAVSPAQNIAAAWERAATAAERTARASAASSGGSSAEAEGDALGGFIQRFASGGFAKGTDTIPAVLSNREFVVNSRQAERFHPQLTALNAGLTPSFPTTSNVSHTGIAGDVNVSVNSSGDGKVIGRDIVAVLIEN